MKATKQDATLQKMSDYLTQFDKAMTELATVTDMLMSNTMANQTGLPEVEYDPQEGISVSIPGNMMGFIKTPERYWQVVSYCMIRHFVLNTLWHDEEQLDQACESFMRQVAERDQPRSIIAYAWHRLTHRRNIAMHYLQMFREGKQIYREYQSLL